MLEEIVEQAHKAGFGKHLSGSFRHRHVIDKRVGEPIKSLLNSDVYEFYLSKKAEEGAL